MTIPSLRDRVSVLTPVVFRAMSSCALVAIWLIQFFLHPLRQDAIVMHEQQLDPTEIVLIPYPWQRSCIFVLANVVATICTQSSSLRQAIQTLFDIVQLSAITMILFVVCGASPHQNLHHTYIASVYFVTCAFFQYPSIFVHDVASGSTDSAVDNEYENDGSDNNGIDLSEKDPFSKVHYHHPRSVNHNTSSALRVSLLLDIIQQQLRGYSVGIVGQSLSSSSISAPKPSQQTIVLHQTIVYCCTILTIIFQILLLYDRGYQIQRYPIPIVLGCTIGWIIGTCVGTIRAIRR